jgi:sodium-dependent dicarboxylate transporter 2/3/5
MKIDKETIGAWVGFLFFLVTLLMDSPFEELPLMGWRTMGLGGMMAIWWTTECVPLAVTAFLPLIMAPLVGIMPMKEISAPYAHPLIYLFLGGFMLSIAMERTGLHFRIARKVVSSVGANPKYQVGGIMLVTAFLSMWMSNTATSVMMLPIAISTIKLMKGDGASETSHFGTSLLLGVAYSASIGGMATLIGTPPNALLAAYLSSSYDIQIGFGQWMCFGVPFSAIMLFITWFLLTRKGMACEGGGDSVKVIRKQLQEMGPMSYGEKWVLITFSSAAILWMLRVYLVKITGLALSDTGIAMTAALVLFLLPAAKGSKKRLLNWVDAEKLPWGVLLLFGGGLALAAMMKTSGLAEFIGSRFENLQGWNSIALIAIIVVTVVFLTEVTSNTATSAGLLPLVGPIAVSLGETPTTFAIPLAVAASCAFMLPVATPPNAIVLGSGELTNNQMAKAGFWLNIISIILIVLFAKWLIPIVFN